MRFRTMLRTVRPFISALAVILTAALLIFAIYFTDLGLLWIAFLGGILVSAILAEATRVSRVEWLATLRTARLSNIKEKLERETLLRRMAEETVAAGKSRLHLIDEVLPTMVALFDVEGHCQYHNRAFADWLHLRPDQTRGQHIRKVLGANAYQETAASIRQALDGHQVQYARTQTMPDGAIYRLNVEHIPQFGEDGRVSGFYMLMNDVTSPGDLHKAVQTGSGAAAHAGNVAHAQDVIHDGKSSQDSFVDSFSEQVMGQKDAEHIRAAIEKGDFSLFCQLISPIAGSNEAEHYEVLVRLTEEEESMIPPGAFFPLAEKHGLMPHLDRWVVRHVTEWASRQNSADEKRNKSIFFINVSGATMADPGFPEFLKLTLLEHEVSGARLCFEIPNSELAKSPDVVAEFARQVRERGCLVALSGFGRDRISFDMIRGFRIEFLKIDGGIIFNILRDPVELAKITAIDRVAKKIGVKTIAELVEDDGTIAKLKEVGIDFAQGFGISRPQPLAK